MLFTKMEATGNDFIVVEEGAEARSWAGVAPAICDRHLGVGADGILVVSSSATADKKMRMFNPDGSEAEMCGNGIRCFAKYVLSGNGAVPQNEHFSVETRAGIKRVIPSYDAGQLTAIKVDMGRPVFSAAKIPVLINLNKSKRRYRPPIVDFPVALGKRKLLMTFLSMGNPHAVCFLKDSIDAFPLAVVGPKVENHEIFPKRVNFEIARVVNQKKVKARVWERGAGATLSCGTGACAVAVAAILHGYTDTAVEVELPGGTLEIEWNGKEEVYLKGPANFVFKGEWIERT